MNNKDLALPSGTGLSSSDGAQEVAALRASIPSAWQCVYCQFRAYTEVSNSRLVRCASCKSLHSHPKDRPMMVLENERLAAALGSIMDFGFRHPGHGYSCAMLAQAALAQGTEARRAETGTGSVHDGPVPKACAQTPAPESNP